jgi:hypothetical protein
MTVQDKLLPLVESIDYEIVDNELLALTKIRMVPKIIHHEAIPEIRGEVMEEVDGLFKLNKDAVIQAGVEAYDETIEVEEEYKEALPSLESVKLSLIDDITLAVGEFLADKKHLVDSENDSINIVDGIIHTFNFKNIEQPNADTLLACYAAAIAKNNQDIINAEALEYLAATDFYIIRSVDSGELVPEEIKLARAEARNKIIK